MKPLFYSLFFLVLFACSSNQVDDKNCRFLINNTFNRSINLNTADPNLIGLQAVGGSGYVPDLGGNYGVIITRTSVESYIAWDATDPNHFQTDCSKLTINGTEAKCGCDDENTYSLLTGQVIGGKALPCNLKNYRVEKSGNTLFISN